MKKAILFDLAIKAAGNADIIGVGFDKSDAILNL